MASVSSLIAACDDYLLKEAKTRRERKTARVERRLTRALGKAFMAQGRYFVQEFRALEYLFPIRESVTPADWLPLFIAASQRSLALFSGPLDQAIRDALAIGAAVRIADVGFDLLFNLQHPRAIAYLDQVGAQLVRGIDETTRTYLQTTISNAVAEGATPKQVEERIIERYRHFAVGRPQRHIDSRAHMIAVTEIGNAYEQGADIVTRDLQGAGIQLEKRWAGPRDDRTSAACLGNMEEGWIDYDTPFSSGDHRPLHHPGCRHSLAVRRKRDAA